MTSAHVPEHLELPPPTLEEVSRGVYAYIQLDGSWGLNNTGFFVGHDGVTVIDTCFTERRTRAFLDAIRSVTDRPLRTLINTHHHGDHTHGNYLLPAATIIGHELCRAVVIATGVATSALFPGVEWGELRVAPPFVTFQDRLNVYVDDLRVELIYLGPAHTTNDVVAWVPDRKLLFAGDLLFNGGTPFVVFGSVAGSLAAIERMRALGAERIVPGHGAVCGPEVPLELARATDLGRFAALHDSERIVGNLHRAYAELRGEPHGAPLPLETVLPEMLAFNGGPLRCLA
jgi:cyclase